MPSLCVLSVKFEKREKRKMYISRIIRERENNLAIGERSVKKVLAVTRLEKKFDE